MMLFPPGILSFLPSGAACGSVALGAAVLLGWAYDLPTFKSVIPGLAAMKAGAAVSFVLAGTSLWMFLQGERAYVWSRLFALGLVAVLALAWIGYASNWMGVQTLVAFTLLAAALLLLTTRRSAARTLAQKAALAGGAVGWIGLIGHAYGIEPLYSLTSYSQMALHTALGVAVLGVGMAAADSGGLLHVLRSQGPGGTLARHLLPFVAIVPIGLGWLHLAAERAGLYDPALGVAVLSVASVVLFAFIVLTYAKRLDRSDERTHSVERVLRESAEFNTQIVASAQEGIVVVDEQKRCVIWNPFMEKLTGIAAEDVVGRPLVGAASFGMLTQLESVERAIAGQHVEDDFERKDSSSGESAWLLITHTPLRNAEGGIRGAIVTIHDITELKRAEQALRESQKRMSTALATAGVGVWEIDLDTREIVWTENAVPLLASAPGAVHALDDIVSCMHPGDRAAFTAAIDRAIVAGSDFDVESRVALPGGGTRWLQSTGRATPAKPHGGPRRLIGVTADVTGRHLLEAQFLQAQKMEAVGQLAGGVAHDFNNLLTAILGYSTLLKDGLTDPARRKNLNEVVKAATRATALTRQLLAFSRQQAPETTVLCPNEVVQDLLDMLRRLIGENISLTTRLPGRLDAVRTDRGQLEQVIVNLVVNARDAMPRGGRIEIETANVRLEAGVRAHGAQVPRGDYVTLSVRDTGTGMSPDVRARLFEPFFTTKDPGRGTGLGLATVLGIVSASRGYISVDSEPGKGTTFTVYLPRVGGDAGGQQAASPGATNAAMQPGQSTILIVEDEEAVRYLTRVILERAGHRVLEAGTAEQAEAVLAAAGPIDLLVSDVSLPGGRGTDLFARLRVRHPALRVIFMSGYADEGIAEDSQSDQAIVFVQKPFQAETLLSCVRDHLLARSF